MAHGEQFLASGNGVTCATDPDCPNDRSLSTFGAFVLLTKINWGIGMVAMPYYLHSAGLWCGIVFFTMSVVLAADSALCLVQCQASVRGCQQETAYAKLIGLLLGRAGESCAIFSLALANFGSAVSFIKFIGDNIFRFIPEIAMPGGGAAWSLLITLPLLLCALPESVAPLGRLSGVGLIAGQSFAVLMITQAALRWDFFPSYVQSQPTVRWDTAPVAMGLAVFCNEGMVIVSPTVYRVMRHPQKFPIGLAAMTCYFVLNYMAVAVSGDFLFSFLSGKPVQAEVSLSFELTALNRVAVLLYVLQLLFSFPLNFFTIFISMETAYFSWMSRHQRILYIRLPLIALAGVLGSTVPSFGDFLAVAGALANSLGIYILPHCGLLLSASRGAIQISKRRKACSWMILMIFGVCAGSFATVVSFQQLVQ
eukprot:TRINITY_DN45443_c0_g1_i1.p1 TRINITY_DN45443_c0_g1~~TRINITY_DN45443_c0_g1_i1.p1  ORF type:complete len:423 (+),score=41.13 TRINITY_DN45443_c0_g1_i1:72-1340(+)